MPYLQKQSVVDYTVVVGVGPPVRPLSPYQTQRTCVTNKLGATRSEINLPPTY